MSEHTQSQVRDVRLNAKAWAISFFILGLAIAVTFSLVMPQFLRDAHR